MGTQRPISTDSQLPAQAPPHLHISIPVELLQQLLADGALRPCQIRCLNSQTAGCLREICMNCCVKALLTQPPATRLNGERLIPTDTGDCPIETDN